MALLEEYLQSSKSFQIVWTSFGIGFEHGMNPELAVKLAALTDNVSFSKDRLYFTVIASPEREDLQLLSLLSKEGTKELYVSKFQPDGTELKIRQKFTVTGIADYSSNYSWHDDDGESNVTSFTLDGRMDVISK